MDRLYSLADIARELGLPHSTVRYYRDRFADYFPTVGEGRNRRYRPEALAVVRTIAEAMHQGMTVEQVEELLAQNFPRNVAESQRQPVATQQPLPYTPQEIAAMVNAMATAIQTLNQSVQQIAATVERIEERLEGGLLAKHRARDRCPAGVRLVRALRQDNPQTLERSEVLRRLRRRFKARIKPRVYPTPSQRGLQCMKIGV